MNGRMTDSNGLHHLNAATDAFVCFFLPADQVLGGVPA